MKTNDVIDAILKRRSTRSFSDEPIPRDELEAIVACGQWAPSANNRQEWTFVVLTKREDIQTLSGLVGAELGNAAYNMYQPTAAVLVAHQKDAPFGREDDACALENMFLAAESLGIGSVWINQLRGICDAPAIRSQLTDWGVPEDYEVYGVAALGYTAKQTQPHERKSKVIWVD